MVRTTGTKVLYDTALHFYIDYPEITYEIEALKLFGDRIHDRQLDVPVVSELEARKLIRNYLSWTPVLGGKNVGWFDARFLDEFLDPLECSHRFIDIGNKYHDPIDVKLPDLELCRLRGLACGVPGTVINEPVRHMALDDAVLCAELYCGWVAGLLDYNKWR